MDCIESSIRRDRGYYTLVVNGCDFVLVSRELIGHLTSSTRDEAHVFDIARPRCLHRCPGAQQCTSGVYRTVARILGRAGGSVVRVGVYLQQCRQLVELDRPDQGMEHYVGDLYQWAKLQISAQIWSGAPSKLCARRHHIANPNFTSSVPVRSRYARALPRGCALNRGVEVMA